MDLHRMQANPSAVDRAAIDAFLESSQSGRPRDVRDTDGRAVWGGREATASRRHLLLPALHAVQGKVGWISQGAINYICERLVIPPADAYGVASFYALLATEKRPPRVAHVCDDIACKIKGAEALCRELETTLGPPGSTNGSSNVTWYRSPCLGQCERAPAAFFQLASDSKVGDKSLAPASAGAVVGVLEGKAVTSAPGVAAPQTVAQAGKPRSEGLRILRRVGRIDPESLDSYRSEGGYQALRRALTIGPMGVIREVTDSKIRGRGGAAFPMGIKWDAVAKAPVRPHYLICNADESEPGTFKDRVLMEEDPFAILEAMTIAGFATGCERGFLYIRGEYPLATRRLEEATRQARNRGFLGDDVMGEGLRFDVEIRRGAGAYICGEETALFNSIEGFRGEPRNKPPFPTQEGLFKKPTVVNNVETLVNVLDIVLEGGPAFASIGTNDSAGPKLFCVSGCVARPGIYEVTFGTTLRQLLDLAGGVPEGRPIQTILLGGAAGMFVSPEHLDVPLTFEGTRAIGATLGSGVVMPFDDTVDLTETVLRIAAFFRDESCGQCVPCRVGTVRQEEALRRLTSKGADESHDDEAALLEELALVMQNASICGLGHTAASVVRSALNLGLLNGKEATR